MKEVGDVKKYLLVLLIISFIFIGSVNGIQGLEKIKETAKELDYHYYYNKDKYIRLFDVEDVKKYLNIFDIIKIDERETIRFEHKKNYIVFIAKK